MSSTWSKIEKKIYDENPNLLKIEKGQRFTTTHYGVIEAINIDFHGSENQNIYTVYGIDMKMGFPRNEQAKDLLLIGKAITLSDVLSWLTRQDHFSVSMEKGKMKLFGYDWDFSKYITEQNPKLIEYLLNL